MYVRSSVGLARCVTSVACGLFSQALLTEVAVAKEDRVEVWKSGELVAEIELGQGVLCLACANNQLVALLESGEAALLDFATSPPSTTRVHLSFPRVIMSGRFASTHPRASGS